MKVNFLKSNLLLFLFYIFSCIGHYVLFISVFNMSSTVQDIYSINKLICSNFIIKYTFFDKNYNELYEKNHSRQLSKLYKSDIYKGVKKSNDDISLKHLDSILSNVYREEYLNNVVAKKRKFLLL